MGIVYSFCFGNATSQNSRANDYKIDEQVVSGEQPNTYSCGQQSKNIADVSFKNAPRDKRRTLDPKDFTFDQLRNQTLVKSLGSINGQQFIIQNCQGCTIALLDHSATVTVDDCLDCNILIGPCKGSVFIRDCSDCRMIIACQQYRTRDCKNMDTFLLCQTQPIIEASNQMRFGCLQLFYDQFQEHLDAAKLSVFNNNWSKIHDFTPAESGLNYSYLDEISDPLEIVPIKAPEGSNLHNLNSNQESSLVPLTLGKRLRPSKEACFCLLFSYKDEAEPVNLRCLEMIKKVSEENGCRLVATGEVRMVASDIERLTGVKTIYNEMSLKGPIVAMEWCGQTVSKILNQFCQQKNCSHAAYVRDGPQAIIQLKDFYNYVDMQHGV